MTIGSCKDSNVETHAGIPLCARFDEDSTSEFSTLFTQRFGKAVFSAGLVRCFPQRARQGRTSAVPVRITVGSSGGASGASGRMEGWKSAGGGGIAGVTRGVAGVFGAGNDLAGIDEAGGQAKDTRRRGRPGGRPRFGG